MLAMDSAGNAGWTGLGMGFDPAIELRRYGRIGSPELVVGFLDVRLAGAVALKCGLQAIEQDLDIGKSTLRKEGQDLLASRRLKHPDKDDSAREREPNASRHSDEACSKAQLPPTVIRLS